MSLNPEIVGADHWHDKRVRQILKDAGIKSEDFQSLHTSNYDVRVDIVLSGQTPSEVYQLLKTVNKGFDFTFEEHIGRDKLSFIAFRMRWNYENEWRLLLGDIHQ